MKVSLVKPGAYLSLSYPVFVLFYLFWFYPVILKTEYILLVIALLFFGISVTIDSFDRSDIDLFFLLEDGVKLVGIVSWLAYFFRVGVDAVQRNIEPTQKIRGVSHD